MLIVMFEHISNNSDLIDSSNGLETIVVTNKGGNVWSQ